MDFSVVEVYVPTPLLATFSVAALLATLLFWLFMLLWLKHQKKSKVAPSPAAQKELLVGQNGVALIGPNYDFISSAPATFACPACHLSEAGRLVLYSHRPSNRVIALIMHNCHQLALQGEETIEIGAVKHE